MIEFARVSKPVNKQYSGQRKNLRIKSQKSNKLKNWKIFQYPFSHFNCQ